MLSDLAFHVLLALGEGPSHGYAIGKAVEEQSGGRLDPTTGALYQVLRRLSEDGFIAEVDGPKDADARGAISRLTRPGPTRPRRRKRRGSTRWCAPRGNAGSFRSARDAIYRWLLRLAAPTSRATTRPRWKRCWRARLARSARLRAAGSACVLVRELATLAALAWSERFGEGASGTAPAATRIQPVQGGTHGHTRTGTPPGSAPAVAQPRVHRGGGPDARARDRRQRRDLRRRRARRHQSAALSRVGSAHRARPRLRRASRSPSGMKRPPACISCTRIARNRWRRSRSTRRAIAR